MTGGTGTSVGTGLITGTTGTNTGTTRPQYTTQNIVDAYRQAIAGGKTEAEFVAYAKQNGITDMELSAAQGQVLREGQATTTNNTSQTQLDAQQEAARLAQIKADTARNVATGNFNLRNIADAYNQAISGGKTEAEFVEYARSVGITDSQLAQAKAMMLGGTPGTGPQAPTVALGPAPTTGINLSQLKDAQQWEVAPNQTVQNQLQQIIASDSPLMQQARAKAMQQANSSGLLNSSMAVTAGQSAVLGAAMPIAQQDAGTFADAAKFNTGEANSFNRDSNAFTRDAFMADFNLQANEWAKKQDQVRTDDTMGYEQRLQLDRDAIQNGYQNGRDAILNGYTVARDAATNAFTLQRDATQNEFTATQNQLEREAAMARVAAGSREDSSMEQLAATINADKDTNTLKVQQGSRDTITNARAQLQKDFISIKGASGLDTATKDQMLSDAINSYNTIVGGHIADAGWSQTDWNYTITSAPPAPAPAPAPAVNPNI